VITRVKHTINGKVCGMFYRFKDGRYLYLSWVSGDKPRSLHVKKNAWCIDLSIVREVERRGCTAIGVAHKTSKGVIYYITNIADMLNPPSEFYSGGKQPQRLLHRDLFLVNTSKSAGNIAKAIKIR
jgi:hypothetical protein